MRRKLFRAVWFVVVPLVALRVWCDRAVRGWWLDTSATAAERIKPGMTLAEAEQIVGGPPGEYHLAPPTIFRCSFNGPAPYWIVWRAADGGIVVNARSDDGSWGPGAVRSVHHEVPVEGINWDELASWSWRVVVCFGVPFVVWRVGRRRVVNVGS